MCAITLIDSGTDSGDDDFSNTILIRLVIGVPMETGDNRRDVLQQLAAQHAALDRQSPALVVAQVHTLLAQQFAEHLDLGPLIRDDLLLLPVDPASQADQQHLPRL